MSVRGIKKGGQIDIAAEIRDSFIANINHALRTPLNGIVGMVDLLSKSLLDEKQHLYTSVIRESSELLMLQLDNIVEMSKIEAGEAENNPAVFRLNDIIQEALIPAIVMASKKGVLLGVEHVEGVPDIVRVDGIRLRKVLTNLLCAALKFTQGGEIILRVEKSFHPSKDAGQIRLQFSIVGSDAVGSALYDAMEKSTEIRQSDLLDFGEVTVSLCTVYELLRVMGSRMDLRAGGSYEPPFRFDLQIEPCKGQPETSVFSMLAGKRVLFLGLKIPAHDTLFQMMALWGMDVHLKENGGQDLSSLCGAYDLVLSGVAAKEKYIGTVFDNVIWIGAQAEDVFDVGDVHLGFPIYPQEMLAALKIILIDDDPARKPQQSDIMAGGQTHVFHKIFAKVLLVEDDFVSRMYATELLEGFGCEVDVAENGELALSRVKDGCGYDIIFMDCMMPILDGYAASQKIRQNGFNDVPIIALTANVMDDDRKKCLDCGMTDYITKPIREADIYAALTRNLHRIL